MFELNFYHIIVGMLLMLSFIGLAEMAWWAGYNKMRISHIFLGVLIIFAGLTVAYVYRMYMHYFRINDFEKYITIIQWKWYGMHLLPLLAGVVTVVYRMTFQLIRSMLKERGLIPAPSRRESDDYVHLNMKYVYNLFTKTSIKRRYLIMWKKLIGAAIKYGLKAAGNDTKVRAFKEVYYAFGRDLIKEQIVDKSENTYDDKLLTVFDELLKQTD